ncbi:FAD-dependent oxidoreductase [Nesterenkonia pannonica]|uniref:FAD-dependent oxidoreductase n=1 Tax=Nesterenkonia pannonica TaxID=1548602 RepID=UPI002164603A|nr:FAD-dependent oxidoreductase [Nesterenkonia pannonica]
METFDVIVIGVGSMGAAAARELAYRGARVLGLRSSNPATTRDQPTGHAHHPAVLLGGSRVRAAALLSLRRLPGAGEGDWPRPHAPVRGIYIGHPESQTFVYSLAAAKLHGLDHEVLTASQIRERFPTMDPHDDALGLFEQNAYYVRPEETVVANVESASARGADLRFGQRVRGWSAAAGEESRSPPTSAPMVPTAW